MPVFLLNPDQVQPVADRQDDVFDPVVRRNQVVEFLNRFRVAVVVRGGFRYLAVPQDVVGQQIASAADERPHGHPVVVRIFALVSVDKDQVE